MNLQSSASCVRPANCITTLLRTAEAQTRERLFRYGTNLREVVVPRCSYSSHVAVEVPRELLPWDLIRRSGTDVWSSLTDEQKASGTCMWSLL